MYNTQNSSTNIQMNPNMKKRKKDAIHYTYIIYLVPKEFTPNYSSGFEQIGYL